MTFCTDVATVCGPGCFISFFFSELALANHHWSQLTPLSQQDIPDVELSLNSAGNLPIQDQTQHVDYPLTLGSSTNTCLVSGYELFRPAVERVQTDVDCCEVRV